MAIKNNKKCLACGTVYSYCPDCSRADALKPSYFSEFCCEDCKDLWYTATKFNMSKLTKAEAKAIISALTLKPADQYVACIQRDLKNIMATEPKPRRGKRAFMPIIDEAIAPVIETEIKLPEPVAEPVIEEPTAIEEVASVEEVHEVSREVVIEKEENE